MTGEIKNILDCLSYFFGYGFGNMTVFLFDLPNLLDLEESSWFKRAVNVVLVLENRKSC